ncbi:MAG TPA: hypothetical protein VH560_15940, partial [Polyangia bacterium]|nr:hypothetical protein [Polyangia bacterium]
MRINHDDKAIAFVCVFVIPLALATVSCTKDLAGSASTTTDDNGSVTTASSASAPPPSSTTAAAATALPMPVAQAAPAVEFPAPAMTPPVMQAVTATQAKLDGLT